MFNLQLFSSFLQQKANVLMRLSIREKDRRDVSLSRLYFLCFGIVICSDIKFSSSLMIFSLFSERSFVFFVDRLVFIFSRTDEMSVALSHGTISGKLKILLDFYSVISDVRM